MYGWLFLKNDINKMLYLNARLCTYPSKLRGGVHGSSLTSNLKFAQLKTHLTSFLGLSYIFSVNVFDAFYCAPYLSINKYLKHSLFCKLQKVSVSTSKLQCDSTIKW